MRRAISLALDRDSLDEVVYNTSKLDAAGFDVSSKLNRHGALPAGWPGQSIDPREDPKIGEFIRFDVAEAMKLMDAAGHGDGFDMPYHYTNVYPGNWGLEGELIQQMIGKIGINLTGGVEDFRAVYTPRTQNGDFDGLDWILSAIPTFVDHLEYFNPDSNDNKSKLDEPAVWAKAEEVLQIVDPEESAQAMQDIQREMRPDLHHLRRLDRRRQYRRDHRRARRALRRRLLAHRSCAGDPGDAERLPAGGEIGK